MRKKLLRWLTCALVITYSGGGDLRAGSRGEVVEIRTGDGVVLSGRVFGSGPNGVLLGHMYNGDQTAWWTTAEFLADRDYVVLTFDLRGHRESSGQKDYDKVEADTEAAYAYLKGRAQRITLIGAGVTGTAAMKIAAREDVSGIVALSASPVAGPIDARSYVGLISVPKLFIASSGDPEAIASVKLLMRLSAAPKRERLFPGDNQGTELLESDFQAAVREEILAFLEEIRPSPGERP